MNTLTTLPAFQAYAAATLVLGFNLLGIANATAVTRTQAKECINPEDTKLGKDNKVVFDEGNDRTQRYRRAHRNALENSPLFIITAFVLTLMGTSATLGWALFGSFAAFRVLHTVCYVKGIQPFRTMFFGLAQLVQFVVLGLIVYGAFSG